MTTQLPFGTKVIITSYGFGVPRALVGTTGTVLGTARTRTRVNLDAQDYSGETMHIRPDQIRPA